MKVGFGLPVSGAWATPDNVSRFATLAEASGYSSLWTFQRLLVPEGSAMEPVYQSVLDPIAAMAYAAAVTTRIRLGVAVINAPYVSPGYLAKQAASVDILSSGRLDLGIGLGWMPEEFAMTGGTDGAPRCADRGVRQGATRHLGRAASRVQRRVLHRAARHGAAQAGPARRPARPARRHRRRRAAPGRPDRRRLGHLEPGRPVQDRGQHSDRA